MLGRPDYGYATFIIECDEQKNYSAAYWMQPNCQDQTYIEDKPQKLNFDNIFTKPQTLKNLVSELIDNSPELVRESFASKNDADKLRILSSLSRIKPGFLFFEPIKMRG